MGNHMAGDLIAKFAEIAAAQRQPNETALDLLDRAVAQAKAVSGFTPDAEFEAADPKNPTCTHPFVSNWTDPHPLAPLGMLMVEAFAPNGLRDLSKYWMMIEGCQPDDEDSEKAEEAANDLWWDQVKDPFRKRFGLC